MSKRKIIKWTLAIGDEDDICLPFGTSVDTDTYGNSEAVNVVDIAVVYKLVEAFKLLVMSEKNKNRLDQVDSKTLRGLILHSSSIAREALKLADIIMDEFTDKLEEKV